MRVNHLNERYSVQNDEAISVLYRLVDTFGSDIILQDIAKALGTDKLSDALSYICRQREFDVESSDEPFDVAVEVVLDRIETLKRMHNIILHMNDEDAYYEWINYMPDEPDQSDFDYIASNYDEYEEVSNAFIKIYRTYYNDGLYVTGSGNINIDEYNQLRKDLKAIVKDCELPEAEIIRD